jgi:RNA polymerase sigma factor (sigma-70 family)
MLARAVVYTPPKAEDYLYLAEWIAKKFLKSKDVKDSEIYSVACEALFLAVEDYTPARGTVQTFLWQTMRNAIIDHIRHETREKRHGECESLGERDVEERPQSVPLPRELLDTLLADAPDETEKDRLDKQLLVDVYLHSKKVSDIADLMGVTREAVYQRMRRSISKIRDRHKKLIEQYEA